MKNPWPESRIVKNEKLCKAATPGPWRPGEHYPFCSETIIRDGVDSDKSFSWKQRIKNAEMCCESRTEFPAALAEIRRLQNPWISVDDELPPISHTEVLIRNKNGSRRVGFCAAFRNTRRFFAYDDSLIFEVDVITHWMPMP